MSRHRRSPWWVRRPRATAAAGFTAVACLAAAVAAWVGPSPGVDAGPPPVIPSIGGTHASGTKPWPTVVPPTIGAPGAWDPDAGLPAATPAAPPSPPRCTRCGERAPATAATSTAQAPVEQGDQGDTADQAAAADPKPAVAAELLALVNRDRAATGCPPVTLNPALVQQSQAWSEQQAADDRMYHSAGPTGFDTWGENVAAGYDTPAQVHDGWMNSPPHRANILTCTYTLMGAAAADSATGVRYWTEQFAV